MSESYSISFVLYYFFIYADKLSSQLIARLALMLTNPLYDVCDHRVISLLGALPFANAI